MHTCSFCGQKVPEDQAERSKRTGAAICASCVQSLSILRPEWVDGPFYEASPKPGPSPRALDLKDYHPKELVAILDRYVVGQEEAKKALAVAVSTHIKRLKNPEIRFKPNLIMVGPTGTGKTYMVQVLAKHLSLPVGFADATSLTQHGYVGDDVETVLYRLIAAAGMDEKRAEMGIVFLDEFDKLARKSGRQRSADRDVGGEGVQYALLKLVEGTQAAVPMSPGGPKSMRHEYITFDTHHVLWIFAGAFEGIDQIVAKRLGVEEGGSPIGFAPSRPAGRRMERKDLYLAVSPDDLINYGIIPELVGRIGTIAPLTPLGVEEMARILVEPEDALLVQYWKLFRAFGVDLEVPKETVRAIARAALRLGTGARGIHTVLTRVLRHLLYEAEPGSKVVLSPGLFEEEVERAAG